MSPLTPIGGMTTANFGGPTVPGSTVHRWKLDDVGTGTATDSIGSADGTVNGVSSVSGAYQGGSAGDGDGTGDYIGTTTLGDFGSTVLANTFSVAYTIDNLTTTNEVFACGVDNIDSPGDSTLFTCPINRVSSNVPELSIRGANDSGHFLRVQGSTTITDGDKHRVVITKSGDNGSEVNIYVDDSQDSTNVSFDSLNSNPSNFNTPFYIFARNLGGSDDGHLPGVIDDLRLYDEALTSGKVSDDYNIQPWS